MRKIKVVVCAGTTCHLMGSPSILNYLDNLPPAIRSRLDISLEACLNHCSQGPIVMVDDVCIERATPERVMACIKERI